MQQLAHPDGELGSARAAASQGVTMTLSTFSNKSMEDVIKVGNAVDRPDRIPAPDYWLQLYCFQNRPTTEVLIQRAQAVGYKALVLTVDTPYLGKRYNEIRNKFALPPNLGLGNFNKGVKTFGETVTLEQESTLKKKVGDIHSKNKIGGPFPDPLKNDNGCPAGKLELIFRCKHLMGGNNTMVAELDINEDYCEGLIPVIASESYRAFSRQKTPRLQWRIKWTQYGCRIMEDVNLIHVHPPLMPSPRSWKFFVLRTQRFQFSLTAELPEGQTFLKHLHSEQIYVSLGGRRSGGSHMEDKRGWSWLWKFLKMNLG